jgi:hypothetical protein
LSGLRRAAALACACAALLSCSVLSVAKAPRPPPAPGDPVSCTRSRRAPWIDTFTAAAAVSGAVAMDTMACQVVT